MCNTLCDKKCVKCKWSKIVNDPDIDDWYEDNDMSLFCTNPNNTFEKEWTSPSQRQKVMEYCEINPEYEEGWVMIASCLRPYELKENKVWGSNLVSMN